MRQGTLVPDIAEVELVSLGHVAGMIEMRLKTCRACVPCPAFGTCARKVHSRYADAKMAELPPDEQDLRRSTCFRALLDEWFKLKWHWETREGDLRNDRLKMPPPTERA